MFLGFEGFSVFLAYMLLFLSTIACIVYGMVNWNKEGEISKQELEEEKKWLREDIQIDEEVSGGSNT